MTDKEISERIHKLLDMAEAYNNQIDPFFSEEEDLHLYSGKRNEALMEAAKLGSMEAYYKLWDSPEKKELLKTMAFDGVPEACYVYACQMPSCDSERLLWIKKAAVSNYPAALHEYGVILLYGIYGVEKDFASGISMLHNAASQNHPESLLRLAQIYKNGLIGNIDNLELIERDIEKYLFYLKKAAELKDKGALYELSKIYEEGRIVPGDIKKSTEILKELASLYGGQYNSMLAERYEKGLGVEKSIPKAINLYCEGEEYFIHGVYVNKKKIGNLYEDMGDIEKAVRIYKSGLKSQINDRRISPELFLDYAVCLKKYNGGIDPDIPMIVEILKNQGDWRANYILGLCYLKGLCVQRDIAEAKQHFNKYISQYESKKNNKLYLDRFDYPNIAKVD